MAVTQSRGPLKGAAVSLITAAGKSNPSMEGGTAEALVMVQAQAVTSYQLATNKNDNAATAPVTGILGGSYVWNTRATNYGGATVSLDVLAADGVSYDSIATRTANGSTGVVLGANATVRLSFTGGTPTGLYSSLS